MSQTWPKTVIFMSIVPVVQRNKLKCLQMVDKQLYCESTFIFWHQFSWFLQNAWVLEFIVSNITSNNQWKNYIFMVKVDHEISENQNSTINNDFIVSSSVWTVQVKTFCLDNMSICSLLYRQKQDKLKVTQQLCIMVTSYNLCFLI